MVHSVIVIGAKGFLGRHLLSSFPGSIGTHHQPSEGLFLCNLSSPKIDWPTDGYRYALLAGGVTNPRRCEGNAHINVDGTLELAKQFLDRGIIPVFFSSSYALSPVNAYGKQKAELEKCALELPEALIIRLDKVYGLEVGDGTLFDEMASQLIQGKKIRAATDQVFAPICIEDVVSGVKGLMSEKRLGVVNFASQAAASRYEIACEVAKQLGCSTELVEPIRLDELGDGIVRPKNIVLQSDISSMSWREGCQKVISSVERNRKQPYNIVSMNMKSEKQQWEETTQLLGDHKVVFGDHWSFNFRNDPRRLSFVLSRYKFAAKMASQDRSILELGCGEGIGAPILAEQAIHYTGVDLDKGAINSAQETFPEGRFTFLFDDFMGKKIGAFQTVVSLDVVEHIYPEHEPLYFETIIKNLTEDGIAVVGTPNETASAYASKASQLGHVNLFTQQRLEETLKRYFHTVLSFGINDEVVHTGYHAMSHYLICVCCDKRKEV